MAFALATLPTHASALAAGQERAILLIHATLRGLYTLGFDLPGFDLPVLLSVSIFQESSCVLVQTCTAPAHAVPHGQLGVKRCAPCAAPAHGRALRAVRGPGASRTVTERCTAPAHGRAVR